MNAPLPSRPARDFAPADFEPLYRNNYAFVWRCARRMAVAQDELDDVIQDVFVIAYRRRDRLEPGVEPSTWLFGILRNVVRNRGRGRARHRRRVDAFAEHVDLLEQQRRRLQTERLLGDALLTEFLRELDEHQRAVFVLAELEGYTGREIAQTLSINPNTAHSRLRLARRAFCAHFGLEPNRQAVASATRELRERPDTPPEQARARSWGLVLAAISRPGLALAPATGLAGLVSAKITAVLAGVGVVSVAVLGWVAAAPIVPREDPNTALATGTAIPRAETLEPVEVVTPIEPSETIDETIEPPVVVQRARPRGALDVPSSPDPAEALRRARAALIASDPPRALDELESIPHAEPRLLGQRAATRVAALCKLGEIERAQATVAQLREREPDSPMLARIETACW
ncbi:putative RNA polymerase ECF-subfamily sigma factor [Enhygromyxa salina]|uniref:Putative RNA polymerase ECF-subfamily sigma factor n=1 Tax=Enhygromyxa salina TaxID=215803 RepID=A0A0C2DJ14_9BACT|nr:sigma-70 family RNA polymerase sigma factor [Enhygromyxa salina]KIG19662.1 putative RNA polymerase ECF-subfamily sigma factor [Enhygromyxa salina]